MFYVAHKYGQFETFKHREYVVCRPKPTLDVALDRAKERPILKRRPDPIESQLGGAMVRRLQEDAA